MENHPQSERKDDLPAFEGLREEEFNSDLLAAWEGGETSYPMIDAAMKMLRATGWINMRARHARLVCSQ